MVLLMICLGCKSKSQPDEDWGRFEPNEVKVTLLKDGRELRLEEDFSFIDKRDKKWLAPKGSIVNGASIPGSLWSVVGSPLVGKYRNASIIHDVGCVERKAPADLVHKVFYEGCRAGGVDESNAQLMYWAVYNFGPSWEAIDTPTNAEQEQLDEQLHQVEELADRLGEEIPPPLKGMAIPLKQKVLAKVVELKKRNQRKELLANPKEIKALLRYKQGAPRENLEHLKKLLPKLKEITRRKPGDTILLPRPKAPPKEDVGKMLEYIKSKELTLEKLQKLQLKDIPR